MGSSVLMVRIPGSYDCRIQTFKMKQMLLAFLAVSALAVATGSPFRSPVEDVILAEEDLQKYGIIDLIPGIGDLIAKLKPLIQEKIDILLDPNMGLNEKVNAIMAVCRAHAPEIVKIVGDFGLKVIIQTILPGIIASMG